MRERLDYRQENEPAEILAALDNTDLEIAIDHVLSAQEGKKDQVPALFGVGCSEKSVYYLDSGLIRGMIVPYDYDMGYQAATAVANRLNRELEPMRDYETGFAVIDRNNMYDEEHERLLFPLAQ
jgi:ribose transport system substrate-binding protein